jgi:hypothetical protein
MAGSVTIHSEPTPANGDSAVRPAAVAPAASAKGGASPIASQAEAATARTSLRTTVTPGIGLLPTLSVCEAAWAFSSVS